MSDQKLDLQALESQIEDVGQKVEQEREAQKEERQEERRLARFIAKLAKALGISGKQEQEAAYERLEKTQRAYRLLARSDRQVRTAPKQGDAVKEAKTTRANVLRYIDDLKRDADGKFIALLARIDVALENDNFSATVLSEIGLDAWLAGYFEKLDPAEGQSLIEGSKGSDESDKRFIYKVYDPDQSTREDKVYLYLRAQWVDLDADNEGERAERQRQLTRIRMVESGFRRLRRANNRHRRQQKMEREALRKSADLTLEEAFAGETGTLLLRGITKQNPWHIPSKNRRVFGDVLLVISEPNTVTEIRSLKGHLDGTIWFVGLKDGFTFSEGFDHLRPLKRDQQMNFGKAKKFLKMAAGLDESADTEEEVESEGGFRSRKGVELSASPDAGTDEEAESSENAA